MPNLGHLQTDLVFRIIGWLQAGTYLYAPVGLRPCAYARNACVERFLETDRTHLWFVDADTVPRPDALKLLLDTDAPVISGAVPTLKQDVDGRVKPVAMVCREQDDGLAPIVGSGVEPIDACGTACLMIRRDVLEAIEPPWFVDRSWHGAPGQDFAFCEKVRTAGFQLFAHFDVACGHLKEVML